MAEQEIPLEDVGDLGALADAGEPTPTEADVDAGSEGIEISIEQFPALQGKTVGEPITLNIQKISDDGNMYTVVMSGDEPAADQGLPTSEEGRAAVESELMGPG